MQFLPDLLIIVVWLLSALVFVYIWSDRLYRFYFWLILWFLLFMVFNLQVKVIQLSGGVPMSGWEDFLIKNKKMILSFFAWIIPVFWLLFSLIKSEIKTNKAFSGLFWLLLPAFILGMLWYIMLNWSIDFEFLKNILWFFKDSKIFTMLQKLPMLLFWLLLIILFWKYIFAILLGLMWYLARLLIGEINDLRWIDREEEEKRKMEEIRRVKIQ